MKKAFTLLMEYDENETTADEIAHKMILAVGSKTIKIEIGPFPLEK